MDGYFRFGELSSVKLRQFCPALALSVIWTTCQSRMGLFLRLLSRIHQPKSRPQYHITPSLPLYLYLFHCYSLSSAVIPDSAVVVYYYMLYVSECLAKISDLQLGRDKNTDPKHKNVSALHRCQRNLILTSILYDTEM